MINFLKDLGFVTDYNNKYLNMYVFNYKKIKIIIDRYEYEIIINNKTHKIFTINNSRDFIKNEIKHIINQYNRKKIKIIIDRYEYEIIINNKTHKIFTINNSRDFIKNEIKHIINQYNRKDKLKTILNV